MAVFLCSIFVICFGLSYETSNGIAADQTGYLKNRGTNIEAQVHPNSQTFFLNSKYIKKNFDEI